MIIKKYKWSIIFTSLYLLLNALWCICFVAYTDAIKNAYYFISLASLASIWCLAKTVHVISKKENIIPSVIMGILFSVISVAANYSIFSPLTGQHLFSLSISIVLSFVIFVPICLFFFYLFDKIEIRHKIKKPISTQLIFFVCFLLIFLVDSVYLYFVAYPGILSPDSISQIEQSLTGQYVHHHPFWHTIIISAIIHFGVMVFNGINAAVALFSQCQIIFMAACFSFVITTIYRATHSTVILIISILFFTCSPYNIIFSVTMWKDVPFAIAAMMLITLLYRVVFHIGNSKFNYFGLAVSIFLFGSWRTNGLIALCIIAIILVIITIIKKNKGLLIIVVSMTLFTVIMNTAFLSMIGVKPDKFSASLSIPLQQVSRVVYDGFQIDLEDKELIEKVLDYDSIAEKYNPILSDPIKYSISDESDNYLKSHKLEYFGLWLRIGLKYPQEYIKAWIDQTKGYWNAGYDYRRWSTGVTDNDFGINQSPSNSSKLQVLFNKYCKIWRNTPLNVFMCIGILTLTYLLATVYFITRKKIQFIFFIPVLSVILTLLIATPVFCEFRYAYILFTCFPVMLMLLASHVYSAAGAPLARSFSTTVTRF